jgi:hypothetical protein
MKADKLPARVAYAAGSLVLGGVVVFYGSMQVLPHLTKMFPGLDPDMDGYRVFKIAICLAVMIAFSLCLYELTLPGTRPRKRRGRRLRLTVTSVCVVLSTLAFNGLGLGWTCDILFAVWLTYTVAYTFVRYGVLDDTKPPSSTLEAYQERRSRSRSTK